MDTHRQAVAESCIKAAEIDTMSFPQIVGRLMEAGFESYAIDFRRATATYYLPDGDSVVLATHEIDGAVADRLDEAGLSAAIREAQAQAPGYSYKGFCAKAKAAGCAGYMVSFPGRRAVYFGRTGEVHVEHFPGSR